MIDILLRLTSCLVGFYWGYQVRKADSIRTVFENCPFDDDNVKVKYDLIIGTSERGMPHHQITRFPRFRHALIVFGGLQGLEKAIQRENDHIKAQEIFQFYR